MIHFDRFYNIEKKSHTYINGWRTIGCYSTKGRKGWNRLQKLGYPLQGYKDGETWSQDGETYRIVYHNV